MAGETAVLLAVNQILGQLDPQAHGKGLGFERNRTAGQQAVDIAGAVAGCQDQTLNRNTFATHDRAQQTALGELKILEPA
ncbi:MAG: hypothetical protein BWY87_00806 [Deltaproteobacteria bacterium ADurb.Bin510]|nr:MAG: hypothetical protein BWY87_00806 [Deltaproteobacteria bacterium ADurb.Bin510]